MLALSKHPEEFKREAAAPVVEGGRSMRDVARALTVNCMASDLSGGEAQEACVGGWADLPRRAGRPNRLRRQIAELELEKEILRRAVVSLARETGR